MQRVFKAGERIDWPHEWRNPPPFPTEPGTRWHLRARHWRNFKYQGWYVKQNARGCANCGHPAQNHNRRNLPAGHCLCGCVEWVRGDRPYLTADKPPAPPVESPPPPPGWTPAPAPSPRPRLASREQKQEPKRKRLSDGARFAVLARDKFTCRYCGRKAPEVKLHVDHVIPVSKGGSNDPANLVTACVDCNLGKHAKMVEAA